VDTHVERNPTLVRNLLIGSTNSLLNAERALDGVNGTRELSKDTISCGIRNATAASIYFPVHDSAMRVKEAKGSDLVGIHETRITCHIGAEDRSKVALGR